MTRFFRIYDHGDVTWYVVATDREHAITILRKQGATWETDDAYVDLNVDQVIEHNLVVIREMTADEVAKRTRCHTEDDERGVIALADARIGDAFCTEW